MFQGNLVVQQPSSDKK